MINMELNSNHLKSSDFSNLFKEISGLEDYSQFFTFPYFKAYQVFKSSELLIGILYFILSHIAENLNIKNYKYLDEISKYWHQTNVIDTKIYNDLEKILNEESVSESKMFELSNKIAVNIQYNIENLRDFQGNWNLSIISKSFQIRILQKDINRLKKIKIYEKIDCPFSIFLLKTNSSYVLFDSNSEFNSWFHQFSTSMVFPNFLDSFRNFDRPSVQNFYATNNFCGNCKDNEFKNDYNFGKVFCKQCFLQDDECLNSHGYDPVLVWTYILYRERDPSNENVILSSNDSIKKCSKCRIHNADAKLCKHCKIEEEILNN